MHVSQIFWPVGRTNRTTYWVLNIIMNVGMSVIEVTFPNPTRDHLLAKAAGGLVFLYIGICLIIGRLHDLNMRGWWCIPLVAAVSLLFWWGARSQLVKDAIVSEYGTFAYVVIATILVI